MSTQAILQGVLRFCYGDSRFTEEDLEQVLAEGDLREKRKLADRVLRHHPDPALVLPRLFPPEELRRVLDSLTEMWGKAGEGGPNSRLRERLLLLRNCLLEERNSIQRLAWIKR